MTSSTPFAWFLLALWVWPLVLAALAARVRWVWLPVLGALPALGVALLLPVGSGLALPWLMLGSELGLDTTGRVFLLFSALLWLVAGIFVAAFPRGAQGRASGMSINQEPADQAATDSLRSAGRSAERASGPAAGRAAGVSFAARRFNSLFLLAMSGQLWAVVGLDVVSFYVGFAIMGLASYALVVADGSATALRAGKLYLAMTVAGEVALFAGLVSLAAETGSLTPNAEMLARASDASLVLVLLGLGVKAAIVPLHLWLPLTYPAAPVAATAVLSSAMIKVAVLGWLRWLPLGAVAWPDWSLWLAWLGLGTAFFALAVGLMQREPKVVLAYSSISKTGFLLLLIGLMLGQPELAGVGVVAILFYAAHHALCKAALFLGLGLFERQDADQDSSQYPSQYPSQSPSHDTIYNPSRYTSDHPNADLNADPRDHARHHPHAHPSDPAAARVRLGLLVGLGVLALALAGAPLTSGAVAKYLTKPLLTDVPWQGSWACLNPLLWLMTLGSMLLMARFLWLLAPASFQIPSRRAMGEEHAVAPAGLATAPVWAWGFLVGLVVLLPWFFGTATSWLTNTANLAVALGLCLAVLHLDRQNRNPLTSFVGWIPPGDVLPWVLGGARALSAAGSWLWRGWRRGLASNVLRLAWVSGAGLGSGPSAGPRPDLKPDSSPAPSPAPSPVPSQEAGQPGADLAIRRQHPAPDPEVVLRTWPVAGALWLGLGCLLLFALVMGGMR